MTRVGGRGRLMCWTGKLLVFLPYGVCCVRVLTAQHSFLEGGFQDWFPSLIPLACRAAFNIWSLLWFLLALLLSSQLALLPSTGGTVLVLHGLHALIPHCLWLVLGTFGRRVFSFFLPSIYVCGWTHSFLISETIPFSVPPSWCFRTSNPELSHPSWQFHTLFSFWILFLL